MDEAACRIAHENVQKALALADRVTPVERDLIQALGKRYAWPAPADRTALDRAYAEAMRGVYARHGADPDVASLFAESLMTLQPWDFWTPDGKPKHATEEIRGILERLLAAHPRHPGANHNYIHTMEASPSPEKALPAADRLRDLVPASGHLVHMPSHIDIRLGRYREAIAANERAIVADLATVARTGRKGFYEIYRAHNYHFVVFAAMFAGRQAQALAHARELTSQLPADLVKAMPQFLDSFMAVPYHVLVRFGRFEDMLGEPEPAEHLPVTRTIWHYARGVSLAALGRVDEAVAEQKAFEQCFAQVPEDYVFGINPARVVLEIGRGLLKGEIEFRRGNREEAFAALRDAVRRDDALRYMEPWDWMQPVRHALGALLLQDGRVAEAEGVYRKDLELHPGNGWALHGLAECLRSKGDTAAAEEATAAFEQAWRGADVTISASCFCRESE
jgi:tetratricopeptide (TPR) repeat protein